MDALYKYDLGYRHRFDPKMVFDWDKAARLIREHNPVYASAGLAGDREWTTGVICQNGTPIFDDGAYLASTWAIPEIDLDGQTISCFTMEDEAERRWPGSDFARLKWPASALAILNGSRAIETGRKDNDDE